MNHTMLTLAVAASLLMGCRSSTERTFNPKPLRDLCLTWGGVPLVVPDSRYVPGSVFQLRPEKPPAFLDSEEFLRSCAVPNDLLTPLTGNPMSAQVAGSAEFGADALLGYQGIEAGAEFSTIKSTSLDVGDARPSGLATARLNVWLQDNPTGLSNSCKTQLESPAYYVVGDTLRIAQSTFELRDKNGVKMELTAPLLSRVVKVQPSANVAITAAGNLSIDQPVTVCVRQLAYKNGALQVLGDDEPKGTLAEGDRTLLDYYDKQTKAK